jgi:hypothetical protein
MAFRAGGITRVTFSQFNKSVVRIVLTLSTERPYDVTNEAAGLRIALQGSGDSFQRWQLGTGPAEGAPVATPASSSHVDAAAPAAEAPATDHASRGTGSDASGSRPSGSYAAGG